MREPYATLYKVLTDKLEGEEQRNLLREILELMSESKNPEEGCERVKGRLLKMIDEVAGELGHA
jgi:hypothetical protein